DSSEHFSMAQHDFETHGIEVGSVKLNLAQMMARKDKIVGDLTNGVAFLLKKNKITTFHGHGRLRSPNEVEVIGADKKSTVIATKNIMLATGSVPNERPFLPFDGQKVISSSEALSLSKVPKHLIVI